MNQKNLTGIILIMASIALSIVSYFVLNKKTLPEVVQTSKPSPAQTKIPIPTPEITPTPIPTPVPTTLPNVIGTDFTIISPNGGENFTTEEPITIKYKISDTLKKKISSNNIADIYLMRNDGLIEGYIGSISDASKTTFIWNPRELMYNGGLDNSFSPPKSGQYKILIFIYAELTAEQTAKYTAEYVPPEERGDVPIFSKHSAGSAKFDGHLLLTPEDFSEQEELMASDTSDSVFTILNSGPY